MDLRSIALDDEQMLEELGLVRRVAQRLLGDSNDADDVVQEAWLRTRTAPVRFESRGRLRAWLAALAHRMARDTLRARRRRLAREERAARLETCADAADVLERSALLERLLQAVRALEEPQRSTILLRYLDGHSTAEIAAAMSVSEEVVRKRLTRTRAHLRGCLGLEDPPSAARATVRRRALQVASCAVLLAALAGFYVYRRAQDPVPASGLTAGPTADATGDEPVPESPAVATAIATQDEVAEASPSEPAPASTEGDSDPGERTEVPHERAPVPTLILSAPD